MAPYWVGTQLFVEKQHPDRFTPAAVRTWIEKAKHHADLDALIIWAADVETYREIITVCREYGVAPYLWFSVLADVYGYETRPGDRLVAYNHRAGNGEIGCWERLDTGDERFEFICPNRTATIRRIFDRYQDLIDGLDLDGVMLDRIRFPSAVNGFESLFSCFCEDCRRMYRSRTGQSLEHVRRRAGDFFNLLKGNAEASLKSWNSWGDMWEEAGLGAFVRFRTASIAAVVQRFSAFARQRGLRVGLDLYSRLLSDTVAQDYRILSGHCDWIKPMSYCRGNGPACLPLEIKCLADALKTLSPGLDRGALHRFLERILGFDITETSAGIFTTGVSHRAISCDLDAIAGDELKPGTKIYPGIAAIRHTGFGVDIDAQVLAQDLKRIKAHTDGFIASWNLAYIPVENLKAIGRVLK